MKLPSELKTKINKIAHVAGVDYGEKAKRRLLADLEHRLAAGASIAELREFLDGMGQHSNTEDIMLRQTHHTYTATD